MRAIGLPELIDDPRFADPASRFENRVELIALMDDAFAQRTLAEWRETLAASPVRGASCRRRPRSVEDPAVTANGYVAHTTTMNGVAVRTAHQPGPVRRTGRRAARRARTRPAHRRDLDGRRHGVGRHREVQGSRSDPMNADCTATADSVEFDPFSQEFFDGAYDTYRRLRDEAPGVLQRQVGLLGVDPIRRRGARNQGPRNVLLGQGRHPRHGARRTTTPSRCPR